MAPNARNEPMPLITSAAEKAVPCQNGFCTPTLLEGTAYGSLVEDMPPAPRRAFVAGFLEEFSHPCPVETSPPGPFPAPDRAALGHAAAGPDLAGPHVGLRRLSGGTLRHRPRLRQGAGAVAHAGFARRGRRPAPPPGGGLGPPLVGRRFYPLGLRRHPVGLPAHRRTGTAARPGRQ